MTEVNCGAGQHPHHQAFLCCNHIYFYGETLWRKVNHWLRAGRQPPNPLATEWFWSPPQTLCLPQGLKDNYPEGPSLGYGKRRFHIYGLGGADVWVTIRENISVVKIDPAGLVVSGVLFTDSKHLEFHHVLLFYAV